jgi:5-methylcytosine-specific restriction endonuclease McrA
MSLDQFRAGSKIPSAHFNLYAEEDGKFRLMTKDHIIPKSKGGANHLDNLQTMCDRCNHRKGDTMPEEVKNDIE